MGAFSDLANARMRTAQTELKAGKITRAEYQKAQKQAGELQAKQIIAQGVYHGFRVSVYRRKRSAFAEGFKTRLCRGGGRSPSGGGDAMVRASMRANGVTRPARTPGGAGVAVVAVPAVECPAWPRRVAGTWNAPS